MEAVTRTMIEHAYHEAIQEAIERGVTLLSAHKEAVTAASMLLAALCGVEDDTAKSAVVALNLRPRKEDD